jgi:phenylalanyl-tRNA synthetase beta chain
MRFSLAWLREHLDGETASDTLAERLTAAGLNVELRETDADDEVWDVDVTANRPDAMNHRGLAREAAAAGCGRLKPIERWLSETVPPVGELAGLTVEDREGCPRYCARVVRGVRVGPSPAWLAERLERCGVRAVNNVVDATNYVMLDLGQPLHAFDLDRLAGREIHIRRARSGETLVTLDGVERELVPSDLVIADAERAVALAGLMGGAATEIGGATTDVLLESAYFAPRVVRRAAGRLGMSTEASHRFERGADRAMARIACDVAAALIAELAFGAVAAGVLDSAPDLPEPQRIAFSLARLTRFTGCEVPRDFVLRVLADLELAPEMSGDTVTCVVPTHRVDLELAEDLYEEVLRHFGYDKIPSALPEMCTTPGRREGSWPLTDRARTALAAVGMAEAVTYSFVAADAEAAVAGSPLVGRGEPVPISNPLSARMAVMRRSLLPGMAEAAAVGLRHGSERIAIGEVGRVFFATADGVREEERLGVVLAGQIGAWDSRRAVDLLDVKGLIDALLEHLGVAGASWRSSEAGVLARGEGSEVVVAGRVVAVAGRLGDAVAALFEAPLPLWVAEIDLACARDAGVPRYQPLPRFPAVVADLTVRHPLSLSYGDLTAAIRVVGPEWLEEIAPVVRYHGEGVAPGEVKTTLRLVYRRADRSLTQAEVNDAHFALMDALAARLPVGFT